ncbi:nitrogen fixation protein FixA, partial [Ensifer sp. IC3342]|nr:nitrogen fixation protein FixA [Ensifer sp. IC3342]
GPGIAKRLNLVQLTYVAKITCIDLSTRAITVERRSEGGTHVLKSELPCLITMLEGSTAIRRGSLEDALRAARSEIVRWNAAEAGIADIAKCGLRGSPTVVKRVFAPPPREQKAVQIDTVEKAVHDVADELVASIFTHQPALEHELSSHWQRVSR